MSEQTVQALMASARECANKNANAANWLGLESALREALAPPGFVRVPLEFVQGFNTLAHNYSLRAEPPDYYDGRAGDAFSNAYARCGEDLAKLRAMLSARPATAANMTDIPPSMTLADRCKTALECMPDSGFRAQTDRLFADLLAAISVADGEVKETP